MKRKLLSKVLNIAAIALLVAQIFPGSSLRAIADTLDLGGEPPRVNLTVYSMFHFIKKPPAGLNPSGGFLVICYVYIKAFSIIV